MLERGYRWFGCMLNESLSIMPLMVVRRDSVGESDFGLGWLVRVIWVESSVLGFWVWIYFDTVECCLFRLRI